MSNFLETEITIDLQNELKDLWKFINDNFGDKIRKKIAKIIELEIELEKRSNV